MFTRILLNSLWGKFGQRNQLMQNRVIKSPGDYYELFLNKKIRISRIIPVGNEMMRVTFEDNKSFVNEHKASNVVIALWTTRYYINVVNIYNFIIAKLVYAYTVL
jgi:hypothetical protein